MPPHGHRNLAHPEPGLYVVGIKSYGRAPTFLITTGNEQVRSVVAGLEVPAAAHRLPPVGVPAQGFITGIAGGGRVAELALTDVTAPTTAGGCGTGGCCAG